MPYSKEKARYWQAVMYPDNMLDNWQENIGSLLQVPFAYCIHNKDICSDGTNRKTHVHIIIVFAGPTTYKNALNAFNRLTKPGCIAIPNDYIQSVICMRSAYDYLRHNTDDCRKKGKYLYPISELVTGNLYDIGNFEQISVSDKEQFIADLEKIILDQEITNFIVLLEYINKNFDIQYKRILRSNSGYFERLLRGNYQLKMIKKSL